MNPLSPFTYCRRHTRQTLLLVGLIAPVTLGIYVMVGMLYPVLEHNAAVVLGPLSHFSLVYAADGSPLEPTVVSQIRAHPDVVWVIPENGLGLHIQVPSLAATGAFCVLGLSESDMQILVEVCDLRLKEGRLLRPRTNEILLSEELASALGLHIGDQIGRSVSDHYYWAIPAPLVLVGILEPEPSQGPGQRTPLGIVSYEYLDSHELYAPRQSGLLVVAREGRKTAVDAFLQDTIPSPRTQVETHKQKAEFLGRARRTTNLVLGVVDCLVAIVVALVVGMINQIALTERLPDFGVLHAIGHHKNRLIRRLALETTAVAGVGWLAGLTLSWLVLAWLRTDFYEPRGVGLALTNLAPLWFALPIPLVVIGFVAFSIMQVFARLDAVAIIERGKLSMEAGGQRPEAKHTRVPRSSAKPLSSWTFYVRHRRRGLSLVAATALMILGVAFPVFFLLPMGDVQEPFLLNHLRYVSEVWPGVARAVDRSVTAQIRAHPAVARVIPARPLGLSISVPPATQTMATIYAVSEDDLPYLVDLFELYLKEGRLPRARFNEVVLSKGLAMNRGLSVGDSIGWPVYERDQDIPTKMVVVGILGHGSSGLRSRQAPRVRSGRALRLLRLRSGQVRSGRAGQGPSTGGVSLGFLSSEYLESHERYSSQPTHFFVVPAEGRKAEVDRWLEEEIASPQTLVGTYAARLQEMQQAARGLLLLFAAVESFVAVVAAIALAALNTIFFAQRRDEFGILHAVGRSRLWLLLRTTRETISVVGVAWLTGAAVCMFSLIIAQAKVYAPMGLRLDYFNLSPWPFTLPIPLAVVIASAGTIARMLSRLDPVSIIERR